MSSYVRSFSFNQSLLLAFILIGAIYVGNSWSPSSYANALKLFQVEELGLVSGTPRGIRSDEWAVITPFVQATVNNDLQRINATSYYEEDLRMVYSMPIKDWGIIFKPSQWLYLFTSPATAFSFYHYFTVAAFLIGYCFLFKSIGAGSYESLLLSCLIFFTGFVQHWWTAAGPVLAYFPWIILAVRIKNQFFRWGMVYWIAVSWIISFFYPPVIISLAFFGLFFLVAYAPESLKIRSFFGLVSASGAAVITACFYLLDYIQDTWNTLYPGLRRSEGGGVSVDLWISQFLPTSQMHDGQSLIGSNICEIGVIGSLYFLIILFFLDYPKKNIKKRLQGSSSRPLWILFCGLILMNAWMLLPIPSWVGMVFLWDRVPPSRMIFSAGLFLIFFIYELYRNFGLKINKSRILVFCLILGLSGFYYKFLRSNINYFDTYLDFVILIVPSAIFFCRKKFDSAQIHLIFLFGSVLVGVVTFGFFNPLQSAKPIFEREKTTISEMLVEKQRRNPDDFLAASGFPGAVLNGWGFRSVSHTLVVPKLEIWSDLFPESNEEELNTIFNRYAHIQLENGSVPWLRQADVAVVPLSVFYPGGEVSRKVILGKETPHIARVGGHVDLVEYEPNKIIITGWAPWKGFSEKQKLYVFSEWEIETASIEFICRPDVVKHMGDPSYLRSGFAVTLHLDREYNPSKEYYVFMSDEDDSSLTQIVR